MKVWFSSVLVFCASLTVIAGSAGSFAGTVVNGPERSDSWLYIEGHNHSVRRVYVGGAQVHYDEAVPASERKKPAPTVLPAGTKVRVTAEQDAAGEWRASEVEILAPESDDKKPAAPTTSQS